MRTLILTLLSKKVPVVGSADEEGSVFIEVAHR
jgi:hypothetical protein